MSINTSKDLRKMFIYQVYIRNHTENGTFNEFVLDLDRIKNLGVDALTNAPNKGKLRLINYLSIMPKKKVHDLA